MFKKAEQKPMKTAIVSIASESEKPYLQEWIDHHKGIGFSEIFVYTNNWRVEEGQFKDATFIPFDGEAMQCTAYNIFLQCNASRGFDWALFIDCDEFLNLNGNYKKVDDFFWLFRNNLGIALNWVLYGDSMLDKPNGDYSVKKRFVYCDKKLNQHIKQALNLALMRKLKILDKVGFFNPHCVNISLSVQGFYDASMSRFVKGPFNPVDQDVETWLHPYIAHFFCKTRPEWEYRRAFGRADTPKTHPQYRRTPEEFDEHNKNDIYYPVK